MNNLADLILLLAGLTAAGATMIGLMNLTQHLFSKFCGRD